MSFHTVYNNNCDDEEEEADDDDDDDDDIEGYLWCPTQRSPKGACKKH